MVQHTKQNGSHFPRLIRAATINVKNDHPIKIAHVSTADAPSNAQNEQVARAPRSDQKNMFDTLSSSMISPRVRQRPQPNAIAAKRMQVEIVVSIILKSFGYGCKCMINLPECQVFRKAIANILFSKKGDRISLFYWLI